MLGLPGNPVSSMVCGLLFLLPVIDVMLGRGVEDRPAGSAMLGAALPANDHRQDYLRAQLTYDSEDQPIATAFERQDSSMFATLAEADCLIVRPPHAPPADAGETVAILRLSGGIFGV